MNIDILIYMLVFMPMVGAFVSYLIGRKDKSKRDGFVAFLTILEFALAVVLVLVSDGKDGMLVIVPEVCGMGLTFTIDGFRVLYAAIACFMWDENKVRAFMKNCQDSGKTAYLDLPNFATKKDIELLEKLIKETGISAVANNYYALSLLNVKVIGGGLNVYNSYTAAAHNLPFISAEGDMGALNKFPYMTFRHCPIKANLNSSCDKCAYADGYYYVLDNGKKLKLKRKKLSSCTFYLI